MNFVYAIDEKHAKELIDKGFELLQFDKTNSVWVFNNKDNYNFNIDVKSSSYVFSDVLTL